MMVFLRRMPPSLALVRRSSAFPLLPTQRICNYRYFYSCLTAAANWHNPKIVALDWALLFARFVFARVAVDRNDRVEDVVVKEHP